MQPYEYLKALKIKASLSNKEIAQKAQQSESNVSRIFNGENDNPSILSIVAIVKVLHGSLDKMFGITEDEEESLRPLVGALRQRVDDQRENIVSLQDAQARQDAIHAERIADMREAFNEQKSEFRNRLEREEARSAPFTHGQHCHGCNHCLGCHCGAVHCNRCAQRRLGPDPVFIIYEQLFYFSTCKIHLPVV